MQPPPRKGESVDLVRETLIVREIAEDPCFEGRAGDCS